MPVRPQMKSRPLLTEVLVVNLLLVAGTSLVAAIGVDAHLTSVTRGREAMVVGLAVVATLLGTWLLLRRRFDPLDQLISTMEQIDLAEPEQVEVGAPRADTNVLRKLGMRDRVELVRYAIRRGLVEP